MIMNLRGAGGRDPVFQSKSVSPGKKSITVYPNGGYNGLSSVTVYGDPDLKPSNIKYGKYIFGVGGNYEHSITGPTAKLSMSYTGSIDSQGISSNSSTWSPKMLSGSVTYTGPTYSTTIGDVSGKMLTSSKTAGSTTYNTKTYSASWAGTKNVTFSMSSSTSLPNGTYSGTVRIFAAGGMCTDGYESKSVTVTVSNGTAKCSLSYYPLFIYGIGGNSASIHAYLV